MNFTARAGTSSRPLVAVAAALVLLGACDQRATAVTVEGPAQVVDGDSLEIGATEIRLFGVDAPEGRQTCARNGAPWRCGEDAATHLRALVGGARITCSQRDVDNYGRTVAVCTRGSVDVGREMVLSGMALAYRQYSSDYVAAEDAARNARRGIWASEFDAPWDFRRNGDGRADGGAQRNEPRDARGTQSTQDRRDTRSDARAAASATDAAASGAAGASCRIKGNINRSGERIYHTPASSSYAETVIDAERGERWFCTEQEAERAGWRAPRG